jgi:acyl carrier protein
VEQYLKNSGPGSRDTLGRIRRVFIDSLHLNLDEEDFNYEAKLDESAGLDSVAVLEFVTGIEKEFGITFEPEMLTISVIRDLKGLVAYVDRRTAGREAAAGKTPA